MLPGAGRYWEVLSIDIKFNDRVAAVKAALLISALKLTYMIFLLPNLTAYKFKTILLLFQTKFNSKWRMREKIDLCYGALGV